MSGAKGAHAPPPPCQLRATVGALPPAALRPPRALAEASTRRSPEPPHSPEPPPGRYAFGQNLVNSMDTSFFARARGGKNDPSVQVRRAPGLGAAQARSRGRFWTAAASRDQARGAAPAGKRGCWAGWAVCKHQKKVTAPTYTRQLAKLVDAAEKNNMYFVSAPACMLHACEQHACACMHMHASMPACRHGCMQAPCPAVRAHASVLHVAAPCARSSALPCNVLDLI